MSEQRKFRNDDGFFSLGIASVLGSVLNTGEGVKESSPPSFRTFGAATAVTENAGGEVESCEGEVVAARDWHGACLPGSAFWK